MTSLTQEIDRLRAENKKLRDALEDMINLPDSYPIDAIRQRARQALKAIYKPVYERRQNTEEWYSLRKGRFTASTFKALFAKLETAAHKKESDND